MGWPIAVIGSEAIATEDVPSARARVHTEYAVRSASAATPRAVVRTYLVTSAVFTLATSIIWGVNTLFLMAAGLTIFEVMLVNSAFTVGQLVFEVPTGVIADTIGRKASFLFASATLFASTLLYVAAYSFSLGIGWFVAASVLIGLGFTFQTGAVDAWLVDALDHTGFDQPKERVFAWGNMTFSAAMLIGTLVGGFLGQIDLALPYLVRAALLLVTFVLTAVLMRELGFEPRPLRASSFRRETRSIFDAGVKYGWRHPVVRPLVWVSASFGMFFMFGFYAWQPYALSLLGRNYVWLVGVLTAAFSLANMAGNSLVRRVMGPADGRRRAPDVLAACLGTMAVLAAGIGIVGLVWQDPGALPFTVATLLWLAFGLVFGIVMPVRQGFLNEQIPSAQRATIISLDSFFADAGGAAGQPALGWIAQQLSMPSAWIVGSVFVGLAAPLYKLAGRATSSAEARQQTDVGDGALDGDSDRLPHDEN